ncbi:unnamed protein product [Pleuronectes platessa]|uniref:Uncharacterized protein n=1 Tax=Pleuronectes platessa TaxID=8262 RepID=A0A9N7VM98_PLEPL|nr:unnamed protein product [Pleuronectes platessa]
MCLPLSSEVENIVCSQPSTCLTCRLRCYSVQPCHRTTSVTHGRLSSLPLHLHSAPPPRLGHEFCHLAQQSLPLSRARLPIPLSSPDLPLVGLSGAAGDHSRISSRWRAHFRSAPLRLSSTFCATETKGEEDEGGGKWKKY